jgi:hypothetical protein
MRNIKDFKTFEAEQLGTILSTFEEDLTNYYKCNKCGKYTYVFNDTAQMCSHCRSNDIVQSSVFDYFADLRKQDGDSYKKELSAQRKRSETLVDLVSAGIEKEKKRRRSMYN